METVLIIKVSAKGALDGEHQVQLSASGVTATSLYLFSVDKSGNASGAGFTELDHAFGKNAKLDLPASALGSSANAGQENITWSAPSEPGLYLAVGLGIGDKDRLRTLVSSWKPGQGFVLGTPFAQWGSLKPGEFGEVKFVGPLANKHLVIPPDPIP